VLALASNGQRRVAPREGCREERPGRRTLSSTWRLRMPHRRTRRRDARFFSPGAAQEATFQPWLNCTLPRSRWIPFVRAGRNTGTAGRDCGSEPWFDCVQSAVPPASLISMSARGAWKGNRLAAALLDARSPAA
jgi:hypothetical protein